MATYKRKTIKSKKVSSSIKGTARSTKKYKLVLVRSTKITKEYTSSTADVNRSIKAARYVNGSIKWYLFTYRPSLKAYRLYKKSSNA
tara:strand:- start:1187 stop:1447 length:261 start_codon:yes stop_codon:yes gene_type:complete